MQVKRRFDDEFPASVNLGIFGTILQAKEAIANYDFSRLLSYGNRNHLIIGDKIVFVVEEIDSESNDKGTPLYLDCWGVFGRNDGKGNNEFFVDSILRVKF